MLGVAREELMGSVGVDLVSLGGLLLTSVLRESGFTCCASELDQRSADHAKPLILRHIFHFRLA